MKKKTTNFNDTQSKYTTGRARLVAAILDTLVLVFIGIIFNIIFGRNNNLIAVYALIPYLYSVLFHYKYGQTIGKKVMNIKILKNNETPIQFTNALLRDCVPIIYTSIDLVFYNPNNQSNLKIGTEDIIIMIWPILELITMLFSQKRRAIHDLIAGTVVVRC
jgi:uncharacterized RDD family membrane protein YckC